MCFMKKPIGLWQLMAFAVISFLGTVLHFLYDLTKRSIFAAPFSGVNESTWEHMKLLFWPMAIYALIQSFYFKDRKDFWQIKLKGVLLGLTLIPVIFYTYNGAVGKSPDIFNVAIFYIAALIACLFEWRLLKKEPSPRNLKIPSIIAFAVLAVLFWVFTFYPPPINLFLDPTTRSFCI